MRTPNQPDPPANGALVPRHPGAEPGPHGYNAYGYDPYDEEAAGSGLLEYWHILKRRKGFVILATFLGGLALFLYTMPQTPIYKAVASIEIQRINPRFMGLDSVNPVQDSSATYNNSDIETQIHIMESESLRRRVVDRLRKQKPPGFSASTSRISTWRRALNLPEPDRADAWDLALDSTLATITQEGATRIVDISVDFTDPALAADYANTLAEEYIQQSLEARWKMTQRTSEWLTQQMEEMRIKLESSEENLQAYARKAGLIYTDAQGSVADDKLRQLQQTLSDAEANRIAKLSRFALVKNAPVDSLPDVLDDKSLGNYQTTLTDLRRQGAELATTFTPEHPKRRRIRAQIQAVEQARTAETRAIVRRIQNEYEEADQRVKLLQADYQKQTALVTDQSAKSVQYNIIKREVDTNKGLYEMMLQRVKSAAVASALEASNVRVVDAARPPEDPYKPNLVRSTFLGLFLGGFLGVAFVIVRERMDQAIKDPGDINFYLNLPELGVIPAVSSKKGPFRLAYRPRDHKLTAGRQPDGDADCPVELVVWKRQPSPIAESFRAALTSILFSGQNGSRPRVLTFTSAHPAEGKTTVVSNLAIALAEVNRRVLLIDADLRRPRLHEILNVPQTTGLSEILKAREPLGPDALNGSIRPTEIENLYVLASGASTGSSTNLLYSERMSELLELLEKTFDTILIDTPPMLQIPDARIVGRMSDAVILVVRAGQTTRDTALAARQRFSEDGTRVLGSILNFYDPRKSSGSRYGYYNYDRYYTHYYQEK